MDICKIRSFEPERMDSASLGAVVVRHICAEYQDIATVLTNFWSEEGLGQELMREGLIPARARGRSWPEYKRRVKARVNWSLAEHEKYLRKKLTVHRTALPNSTHLKTVELAHVVMLAKYSFETESFLIDSCDRWEIPEVYGGLSILEGQSNPVEAEEVPGRRILQN